MIPSIVDISDVQLHIVPLSARRTSKTSHHRRLGHVELSTSHQVSWVTSELVALMDPGTNGFDRVHFLSPAFFDTLECNFHP